MNIGVLAQNVTALVVPLMPYLTEAEEEAGEAFVQEIGMDGWDKAKTVWETLWPRVEGKEAAKKAVQQVLADPSNEDAVAVLRRQIRNLLAEDVFFAGEITVLVEEFRTVCPQHFEARFKE
jgi:hypothetical protein